MSATAHTVSLLRPRFVGLTLATFLSGAVLALSTLYFIRYGGRRKGKRTDPAWQQVLCAVVTICVLCQSIWMIHQLFTVFVEGWGSETALYYVPNTQSFMSMCVVLVVPIVQASFAWRAYVVLQKPIWFFLVCSFGITYVLASGFTYWIITWRLTHASAADFSELGLSVIYYIGVSNFAVATAIDLLISGCFAYTLQTWRNQMASASPGQTSSNGLPSSSLLTRFLAVAVHTAAIQCALEISALALSVQGSRSALYMYTYPSLTMGYAANLILQLLARPYDLGQATSQGLSMSGGSHKGFDMPTIKAAYSPYAEAHSVIFREVDTPEKTGSIDGESVV